MFGRGRIWRELIGRDRTFQSLYGLSVVAIFPQKPRILDCR